MSRKPEYERGYQNGVCAAVTWLHERGRQMNDPHAKAVLDCAADHLGKDRSIGRVPSPSPSQIGRTEPMDEQSARFIAACDAIDREELDGQRGFTHRTKGPSHD